MDTRKTLVLVKGRKLAENNSLGNNGDVTQPNDLVYLSE
jgi:hypothetical protein